MVFDCGHGAAHSVFASELLAECAGAGAKAAVWVKRRMAAASLGADNFLNAAGGSATPSFAVSPASAPASPCLRSLCALESSCFRIQRKQAAGRLQERGQPGRRGCCAQILQPLSLFGADLSRLSLGSELGSAWRSGALGRAWSSLEVRGIQKIHIGYNSDQPIGLIHDRQRADALVDEA